MEEKSKKVALSDDALDGVAGGLQICSDAVMNDQTGEVFTLLVDKWTAYGYLASLGDITDNDRIAALRAKGYIA